MIRSYFKIALRNLTKFKGYALINLTGLSLGLAAGILILLYVLDEVSYDRFHAGRDRIYRVETSFHPANSTEKKPGSEANGWPVGKVLEHDFPEVEAVLYSRDASYLLVNHDEKKIRERSFFMSREFFTIFSFPLKKGNPATALNEPYSMVISETLEKKYFKDGDALNKTLVLGDTINMLITGVLADMPSNSHIQADMLVSFATYEAMNPDFKYEDGWGNINMHNYLLLRENTDAAAFTAKAKNIYMQHAGEMMKEWGVVADVLFNPLTDLYLKSKSTNSMGPMGSIDRVYLVSGIAVFVMMLACINFINLATARSVRRAKEVGLRKVVGSTRFALIGQYLSESLVLTLLSFFLALVLIGISLPMFNVMLAKHYQLSSFLNAPVLLGIVLLIAAITFLSGYYPALVLSALKPVEILKGKMHTSERGLQLRRGLVVFQFVISVSLVSGTFVVLRQLDYMQKETLGFAKDEIFVVNAGRIRSKNPETFETFRQQLLSNSMVRQASLANSVPANQGWNGQVAYPEGHEGERAVSVEYLAVDDHYVSTLGLTVMAGRNFDPLRESDKKDGLVLNETAVKDMGWASPENAIGKKITSPSGYPAGEVIGVVRNYHQLGLQQKIGPIVMDYNPRSGYLFALRYKAADTRELISTVETLWKKNFPGYDFLYFFMDQDFEKQYQSEQRLGNVFALFSMMTIVIAVIGLSGLVSFMTVSRTKEIGIRKVLGASAVSITRLLSAEFILLVLAANAVSIPLVWYFAGQWLNSFASRILLGPGLFVSTGALALLVTFITVSLQTIRAAVVNPVNSLRYE